MIATFVEMVPREIRVARASRGDEFSAAWIAGKSHALFVVHAPKSSFRRDAETNTPEACATRNSPLTAPAVSARSSTPVRPL